MKLLFSIIFTVFLAACATAAPVIVETAEQSQSLTAETAFPITCMREQTFNEVTGNRARIMEFNDTIDELNVVVHIDHFEDEAQRIIVIYHTFESAPGLVCVLHATPATGAQYFLEDLI